MTVLVVTNGSSNTLPFTTLLSNVTVRTEPRSSGTLPTDLKDLHVEPKKLKGHCSIFTYALAKINVFIVK